MSLSTSALQTLNVILFNWDDIDSKYKSGYKIGKHVYDPKTQLKRIHTLQTKKSYTEKDWKTLALLPSCFRHTVLKDMYEYTIKTNFPEYVENYITIKGICGTLVHRSSSILICENEALLDTDKIDCEELNAYIFEHFKVNTFHTLEKIGIQAIDLSSFEKTDWSYAHEKTYEVMLEQFETEWCQIKSPLCYVHETNYGSVLYSWRQVTELNAHLILDSNDGKPRQFTSEWLKDTNKRTYSKMDMFPPPLQAPEEVYNIWKDWNIPGDEKLGEYKTFLDHLKLVMDGEEWLTQWFSHIIRKPGQKTLMCPILRGKPGTGKSLIVDIFIKMIGTELGHSTGKLGDVFEKHSKHRKGRIFVNVDEVDAKSGYMHNEQLKNAITALTFKYEPKGIDESTLTNFNNFMITTNNAKSIVIQENERRYTVFDMSDEKFGDHAYFDRLLKWSENKDNIKALFVYLQTDERFAGKTNDESFVEFNLKNIPKTEALIETRVLSLPTIITYIEHRVVHDFPENWNEIVSNKTLFEDYKSFAGISKEDFNIQKFGCLWKRYLNECDGFKKDRNEQGYVWKFDRKVVLDWLIKKEYTRDTILQTAVKLKISNDY